MCSFLRGLVWLACAEGDAARLEFLGIGLVRRAGEDVNHLAHLYLNEARAANHR